MPENSALPGGRTLWMLCGLLVGFAAGLGTGLVVSRQGKQEANVAPQRLVENGVALQVGEIDPFNRDFTFEVYYQRPYKIPPELKIVDWGPCVEPRILDQWPHGFRVKVVSVGWTDDEKRKIGKLGSYEARGVLAN